MKCNLIFIIILGVIFFSGNISNAYEDFAVPSDTDIVQQADLIIGGVVGFSDTNEPIIIVKKVFKGNFPINERIRLAFEKTTTFPFSLTNYLKPYYNKQVIVLGKYNSASKTLLLPWLVASIWPYQPHGKEILIPPDNYKDSEDFLVAMLEYIELGKKDKDLLINKLLDDVNSPSKRYAVLGYSIDILPKVLNDTLLTEQVCASLLADIVSNDVNDPYTVNNVAMIHYMPPSVWGRYLIEASFCEENAQSELAFKRARNILTRNHEEAKKIKTPQELEAIFKQKEFSLKMADAHNLLKMFDSNNQRLRQSANKVLGIILKDSAKPDESVTDKKAYWRKVIQQQKE